MNRFLGGWPGTERETKPLRLHVFSVRRRPPPPWATDAQAENPTNIPLFYGSDTDRCKLALLPVRESDGQINADVLSFFEMYLSASKVKPECSPLGRGEGGFTLLGEHRKLMLAMYESGSKFDDQIEDLRSQSKTVCANGTSWTVLSAVDIDGAIACNKPRGTGILPLLNQTTVMANDSTSFSVTE